MQQFKVLQRPFARLVRCAALYARSNFLKGPGACHPVFLLDNLKLRLANRLK
ncbi:MULTISPECIES: hypothetical protein [Sinorhizobium]|uniref:hypothetical protein n=1 Tax=Sinorhizobium TaxID=28105 RepID=UPI0015CF1DD3|nr:MULTISPECIES: hypothetical protein [Sinorhizobium]